MKEENNNIETNVNVNPQPVDINTVPVDNNAIEMPQVSTPVDTPAPVEMPSPVSATPVQTEIPAPEVAPVASPVSAPVEASPASVEAAPVEMPAPAPVEAPTPIEAPNVESASMSNLAPVVDTPQNAAAPDMASAEDIAKGIQDGSFVNAVSDPNEMIGAKVGSSSDPLVEEKKKKSKKKVVTIVIVLVVLIILGVLGFLGYNYEYKTANKRVDVLFDKINSYTTPLLKDFEKRIGDYDLDASVTMNTDKIQLHLSGNYAYNLEDYIYLDTSIDKIYYNQDLLDKTPIKFNVYLNDDKAYFKSEELFSKYISTDVEGLSTIMNNIKQNDVNYSALYLSVMNAFKDSLEKYTLNQTIGDATIDGTSKKANIVTMTINKNNYNAIIVNMLNSLSKSDVFLSNAAAIVGESKEDIKTALTEAKDEKYEFDGTVIVKIYTKIIGNELYGIDVISTSGDDKYQVSIIPQGTDSYKVVSTENGTQSSNFVYSMNKTQSSGKVSYVSSVKGDVNYEKSVYQLDVKYTYNINLQYQEDKPVVREKVSLENLTAEDYTTIVTNAEEKYGIIGTYISSLFSLLNGGLSDEITTSCSQATNCNCDATKGYCDCQYTDDEGSTQTIQCPLN